MFVSTVHCFDVSMFKQGSSKKQQTDPYPNLQLKGTLPWCCTDCCAFEEWCDHLVSK